MKKRFGGRKSDGDWISDMGRERRALRARRATVALLVVSAFLCLVPVLAGIFGYIPYAFGPSVVMVLAAIAGFVISIIEARRLRKSP